MSISKSPTIRQLASQLGVSKSTVALALRNDPRLPETTRRKIITAAEKAGYRANPTVSHLMAELRKGRYFSHKATLGFLHGMPDRNDMENHQLCKLFYNGALKRANGLGYNLDPIWLYDTKLRLEKLKAILFTRNIQGLIFNNAEMIDGHLPKAVEALLHDYPCVFDGISANRPLFQYCGSNMFSLAWTAVENAHNLGYRRCGLVIDERTHKLSHDQFLGGFMAAMYRFYPNLVKESANSLFLPLPQINSQKVFIDWFKKGRPDVILMHEAIIKKWISELGMKVPKDVGMIHLDVYEGMKGWAGIDHNHAEIGEATVDILVGIIHRGERGPARHPSCTLVSGTWVKGPTVKKQR